MSFKDQTSRILRWFLKLAQYDYTIVHRPRKHQNIDTLSRDIQETSNFVIKAKELFPMNLDKICKAQHEDSE